MPQEHYSITANCNKMFIKFRYRTDIAQQPGKSNFQEMAIYTGTFSNPAYKPCCSHNHPTTFSAFATVALFAVCQNLSLMIAFVSQL